MIHTEGDFASEDGNKLYYQSWQPEQGCKAISAIIHGSGEFEGFAGC